MKKNILVIALLFSIFMIYDNAFAEQPRVSIDDYKVEISFDDEEDVVIVKESFYVREAGEGQQFSKDIYSEAYDMDSNFMEIADYKVSTVEGNIQYMVNLEKGVNYYANYKIKSKNTLDGDIYYIKIVAPKAYDAFTIYRNSSFGIISSEKNKITKDDLLYNNVEYVKVDEDGNTITGYIEGDTFDTPFIQFDKLSHYVRPSLDNSISFTLILIVASALIFVSLLKYLTYNKIYDYVIISLVIAESLIYIISNIINTLMEGIELVNLIPLGFCVVLYSAFFAAMFFRKPDSRFNDKQRIAEAVAMTFAKLFVMFHSFVMISAVSNISNMDSRFNPFDISNNLGLLLIEVSFFVASYAFQYFDKKGKIDFY